MNQNTLVSLPTGVSLRGAVSNELMAIISTQALEFLCRLQRRFNPVRIKLLQERQSRQAELAAGKQLRFLAEGEAIRAANWQIAPLPQALQKRHVEITGPVDRKMVINALNSGADVFMADFEDANAPSWQNCLEGQKNLSDAVRRQIDFSTPEGKHYALKDQTAVLLVRPRGWHLVEKHLLVDDEPISASLFDFGLYLFHNAQALLQRGWGPYFYLPKLESAHEARLWNDVFVYAQELLGLPIGTIKATVLIETITAAFEMEEILFELRYHMAGLNAGRWDYIFSVIKKLKHSQEAILPDRSQVTMTSPFMQAYAQRLVQVCHKRGAHAMGGMAAFIPSRRDADVNATALAKVREDKRREVSQGFDGTWVAHPDLVAIAREAFDAQLGEQPHQKQVKHEGLTITAAELQNFAIAGGKITEAGIRLNINVALQYVAAWLQGSGAVAIHNLMEDAATAEISRAQLWQWLHHNVKLNDDRLVDQALMEALWGEELATLLQQAQASEVLSEALSEADAILRPLVFNSHFAEFLTLPAYDYLD